MTVGQRTTHMRHLSLTLISGICFLLGVVLETWYEQRRDPLSRHLAAQSVASEPMSLYLVGAYTLVLAFIGTIL